MTSRLWRRRETTKRTTAEQVRACFAALWGWPFSGEKPVSATCFRCERSKSLARRYGSGQRDARGVGHTRRWTQGRQESGHQDPSYPRSLFQCALLVCSFISLFLNTAKSQDNHTAKRQGMDTFVFLFQHGEKPGISYGETPGHPCGEQPGHAFTVSRVEHLMFRL